jgi:multicomponent Na+:H+ antiporter subunit C
VSILLAALIAWLFAVGVWLLLQRALTRIILGFGLLGHGAVLLLLAEGGRAGEPPLAGKDDPLDGLASPLPQALGLTAIVISFAMTGFLLSLAFRSWIGTRDDEVEDDIEDARIRRVIADEEGHYHPEGEPSPADRIPPETAP